MSSQALELSRMSKLRPSGFRWVHHPNLYSTQYPLIQARDERDSVAKTRRRSRCDKCVYQVIIEIRVDDHIHKISKEVLSFRTLF